MGMSSDAKLIYGYNLGGDEHEWQFAEYDEDSYRFTMPWFDNADDASGFADQAEKRLLVEVAGWVEEGSPGNRPDGYFDRKRAAEKQLGVKLEIYGSYDFSGRALAAHSVEVEWGAKVVDIASLNAQAAAEDWGAKLAAAICALGITPKQERPGWILCSMYG